MTTLVIHPKDKSTDFLSEIYLDKNWTIINNSVSTSTLKKLITEHDRIIMLGHGSNLGMFGFNHLLINSNLVYLLRTKICICIWCNADLFVRKYNLNGIYTGMIISEYEEAIMYGINPTTNDLYESNSKFALTMKNIIDLDNLCIIDSYYNETNDVINFNRNNIYKNV